MENIKRVLYGLFAVRQYNDPLKISKTQMPKNYKYNFFNQNNYKSRNYRLE